VKKPSKVLVIMMWALLMALLVSSPAKADWWSPPTQLTYSTAPYYSPSISGDGTKIAFQSNDGGDLEIWVINSDGTGLKQLTNNTSQDGAASISGDGTKIAFNGNGRIWVVNSDGTELQQVTNNITGSWSPSISGNGNKIAFSASESIWVVNSDGTELQQVTNNTASDRSPSISDDGTKIAFSSNDGSRDKIWVVNSDGTGLKQLTNSTAGDWAPSISGDGTKIAFQSDMGGDYEVWVVNSDGTELKQLTNNTANDYFPSISGDGTKIAFESTYSGDDEVWLINSDGTGLKQLTNHTTDDYFPSISSDGTKIAFQSDVDGNWNIWVISQDVAAPVTAHDYDSKWHNTDLVITLSPTDELSGVAETYYKINNDSTRSVSTDGQPTIITEGDNIFEYWSIDNAGNEELPHKIVYAKLDKTPPVIGEPTQQPDGEVQLDQPVKISVEVTDTKSGVKNMTLSYNTDNGDSWANLPMDYNATCGAYQATIPGQGENMLVEYKMLAYDNAGNSVVKDHLGKHYTITVTPEFPSGVILPIFLMATLFVIVIGKKCFEIRNVKFFTKRREAAAVPVSEKREWSFLFCQHFS
jgi:Tol biopolymer transport system component